MEGHAPVYGLAAMVGDRVAAWPDWVLERAAAEVPDGLAVVAGSTPVVSFGAPVGPEVATLGINPSSVEFLDRYGMLLTGDLRRLATDDSLDAAGPDPMARAQAVVDDCAGYFGRRPYRRWFDPLDRVLGAMGCSYYDSTASHLDLVQWATAPVWKALPTETHRRLLTTDMAFLRRQLVQGGWRTVLVNGRTVMRQVEATDLVHWTTVGELPGPPRTQLVTASYDGVRFLGWSANIQSQHGALALVPALTRWVAACTS